MKYIHTYIHIYMYYIWPELRDWEFTLPGPEREQGAAFRGSIEGARGSKRENYVWGSAGE